MKTMLTVFFILVRIADINADNIDESLSKVVTNQSFQDGDQFWNADLKFKDKSYSFEYQSEGRSWYNTGNFEIKNGKVNLKTIKCLGNASPNAISLDCRDTFGHGNCYIKDTPTDINYERILRCETPNKKRLGWEADGFFFPLLSNAVKVGSEKNYQGVKVLILGSKKAKTIDVVKIREAPSLQSKLVLYRPENESDQTFPSVPKNTEIVLIARTLQMESVKEWKNYWYLIKVGYNKSVWMFGEFIKITE